MSRRAVDVREAGVADARAIALVHVEAWRAAYRGLMPDDFLDGLDVEQRTRRWRAVLSGDEPWERGLRVAMLVGVVGDVLAGWAVGGQSRDDDVDVATAEVHAINVHPDHWGSGVGPALFEAALAGLRGDGYEVGTLWVLDGNARARRFYERYGWTPDGSEKVDERRGFRIVEVRYRGALAG